MNVSMASRRLDGDTRNLDDLAYIAHQLIDELVAEIRWKRDLAYGTVKGDTAGVVSGGGDGDPTSAEATSRQALRRKVGQGIRDLRYLVDRKLPEIAARLEVDGDRPLLADEERGAHVDGGLSAYRGDRRAPVGRPDLREALDAQRRRLGRGEGYGAA